MKRRSVLISLAAGAAGAGAFGTGAFSSVEANRDLTVNVAGDENAYLRIAPADTPNGAYATGAEKGALALDFTDGNDNLQGAGINPDAVTYFDEVFVIQNQGTEPIALTVSPLAFVEFEPGTVLVFLLVPLDSLLFGGDIPLELFGGEFDAPNGEFDPSEQEADETFGLHWTPLGVGDTARFSVLAASFEQGDVGELGFADELEIEAEAIDNAV